MTNDFAQALKNLPAKPGVYLMYDKNGTIIYIGKAVSLKNRVRQYFHGGDGRAMLAKMVPQIDHFETIITDSELEALVLENNLIKENRPKYNTLLKDDKTYPYIKVTVDELYPRILLVRQMKKDGARYFGPYTNAGAVRTTIDLLQKLYHIRSCRKNLNGLPDEKSRPCLNHHMGRCPAPCQAKIRPDQYRESINKALDFLNGNYKPVEEELRAKMMEASEKWEFEQAAVYKQLLEDVSQVAQKQKITASNDEDRDIIALAMDEKDAVIQVFFVREGKLIGREHFYMNVQTEDSREEIVSSFIKQYYSGTPFLPKELYLQAELPEADLIENWLSQQKGSKVYLRVPKKGQKEKLVELAEKNASMVLDQNREKLKREEQRTLGAMRDLARLTALGELHRVEAFDISNISGFAMVGSMVVFEDGKPKKSDYRKFRIKSLSGQNDYAAMQEVLTRRFSHGIREREEKEGAYDSFTRFPDLLLMDGGKGQVHIAEQVLEELGLHIPVCGMVKDDHHRTRGLYVNDKEVPMDKTSAAFHLITRVQDEAHRFAITYHRSLRSKNQVHSLLDDIPGIGPARRKALMKHFVSIDAIREASPEELARPEGMNMRVAQEVYDFLHNANVTDSEQQ
jgi:excinuclease ABC subunit C